MNLSQQPKKVTFSVNAKIDYNYMFVEKRDIQYSHSQPKARKINKYFNQIV